MTRARAGVGDLVEDTGGRHAIVTDIKQGAVWVLRPVSGGTTNQWETDEPESLHVIETREERVHREKTA
ncbi:MULTISPECIES: hypothetical protein [Streptomyces]|uniref:hypothetical protein n=1 Tax=Streptomyces TaxID=1883 RepID=UPI001673017B|nr:MULTISPECIES: hypothetical protein [Streptomyces]MBK3523184.1 hypothetical protein [Streptomyces sp. MBT70]GGR94690.1 hypothetical protein GCM10010236_56550 [Streptomyces eurythermus]